MTIDIPYYTGLLIVAGLIIIPICLITAYTLTKTEKKKPVDTNCCTKCETEDWF